MSHQGHDLPVTTIREFETAVLVMLHAPRTKDNYAFLNAWIHREGGGGRNNPLNTTLHEPGSTSFNSVGVQNFPTLAEGAHATYQTLNSPYYRDIVAALRSGHPSRTRTYAGLHTWSGGGYSSLSGVGTTTPQLSDTAFASGSGNPLSSIGVWLEGHIALLVLLLVVLLLIKGQR